MTINKTLNWPYTNAVDPNIYNHRTDWPKISIVTPSYNQGQFIEETILSVLSQNYPNLEYIIIDGGSTDGTVDIIKQYENSITYWVSEKDQGQGHAINKGFEKCEGDIIGWINSDDLYLEKILYYTALAFLKKPDINLVSSNSICFIHETKNIYKGHGKPITKFNLIYGGIVPSHTTFWKKEIHQNIDEKINCAIDYELWLRILDPKKTKVLNYFGGVFRYQQDSKSVQKDDSFKQKWIDDDVYIIKKHHIIMHSKLQKKIFSYHSRIYHILKKISYKIKNKQQSTWPYFDKT